MKKFIRRAIQKLPKLDNDQITHLIDALASEYELLSIVLDSLDDGVMVTDSSYRLILNNKSSYRMLPLQRGELEEKVVWAVIQDHDIADYLEIHMTRNDRIIDEEFYVQKGPLVSVLSVTVLPLVREKRIEGNIILLRDITEKKQKEVKYRRAENLASLTTLAAGVAHEIKNPLASIGIHIQLMRKQFDREGCLQKAAAEEYLAIIDEEIERLNGIVVDFLFAVRPMDTRMKPENLNGLITDMLEFIKYELEQHKVVLKKELSEQLPKIEMDSKYMKQVLLNIIKNAIGAMPDGGELLVKTFQEGNKVHIQIRDTGVGISQENMTKIFEPYFTTKDFGSGLGLTVVYKVIKEHQGEISLDSKEGEGTMFDIALPIPAGEHALLEWR